MSARELTCQEVVELITDYLEGGLRVERRAEFEEHLSLCDGCERYLEQMRTTIRLTGMLTEESLPAGAREKLLAAFRSWRRA